MYDQVTLKLNVDPWILSALKEDITSEDVSTNSVMPHTTGRRSGSYLQRRWHYMRATGIRESVYTSR